MGSAVRDARSAGGPDVRVERLRTDGLALRTRTVRDAPAGDPPGGAAPRGRVVTAPGAAHVARCSHAREVADLVRRHVAR